MLFWFLVVSVVCLCDWVYLEGYVLLQSSLDHIKEALDKQEHDELKVEDFHDFWFFLTREYFNLNKIEKNGHLGSVDSALTVLDAENIATITSDIIRIPTLPGDKNFAVKNIIQKLGNNSKFAQIKIVYMEFIIRLK